MDGYLEQMSDSLGIPAGLKTKGCKIMDSIFQRLQQRSRYPLARLRPLGGIAKATSIWYKADYDCVVYINDESPLFKDIISEFQDIILLMDYKLTEEDFKVCPHLLKFSIDGVDFDLLTATNMVPRNDRSGDTVLAQHRAMLQKIKRSRDLRKAATDNSAGLMEASVEFVKRQSTFVHKVARLAKFWNTTIFYPKYFSGRSTIMETLAIKAGQEEESANRRSPSILRAFRLFLVKVREIRTTNLCFFEFYNPEDVPSHISQARPLLLDPSNPYNNYLHGLKEDAAKVFAKCANESLRRFVNVEKQWLVGAVPDVVFLFEPQPPVKDFIPELGFIVPPEWLSSSRTCSDDSQPHIYIRRADGITMPKFLDCIKYVFAALAETNRYQLLFTANNDASAMRKAAKENIKKFIDKSIRGKEHTTWQSTDDSEDDYDVTFVIPVGAGSQSAVRISARWGRV